MKKERAMYSERGANIVTRCARGVSVSECWILKRDENRAQERGREERKKGSANSENGQNWGV